jgi:alkylated DNA repair dioxygenase AlkB
MAMFRAGVEMSGQYRSGRCVGSTSMETVELSDGGLLLYDDAFLPSEAADRYFVELRDHCPWELKPGIFGYMQPRLIASYGDEGVTYKYSGVENVALPWTATLLEIKKKIETVQGEYNYCLLNRYRSGSDSMGWHADNEPEMGNVIGSLSWEQHESFESGTMSPERQRHLWLAMGR